MLHLFNFLLIGLVLLNVIGLALLTQPWVRLPFGLTQGCAITALCAVLFFVEHFFGLGSRLGWLLPFLCLASAWLVWRRRAELLACRWAIFWLLAGFGYSLLWRYVYPDIDANTERLADLSFVADYARGERLPPPDLWYPPFTLNHYYSFQHYGAGLLARVMNTDAGTAYNIACCLLTALVMAAAFETVRPLCRQRWAQALVLVALLAGGTGASIFTPFMVKSEGIKVEKPWDSMRFVGGTTFYEDGRLTAFGRAVKALGTPAGAVRERVQEMPMETLTYVVQLGDYHAPLGGFFLLALSLGVAVVLLRDAPAHPAASATLAATIPLTVAVDTWSLPLQVPLVAGVLGYLMLTRGRAGEVGAAPPVARWRLLNWPALALGFAGACFLFYPFFSYFLVNNVGNKAPIKLIRWEWRTPEVYYLMVFWPVLLIALAHLFGVKGERKFVAIFWFALLALTELFFVDDIYGGSAERFNTTLKWWPWVFDGILLTLGAANLDRAAAPWRRWLTTGAFGALLVYLWPLGVYWWTPVRVPDNWKLSKNHAGQLDGAGWLRVDPKVGSVLSFLKAQPPGTVLESPDERAFCSVGAFALFTNRPALIGWASHENLWRSDQSDINNRYDQARAFYRGELPDPLRFLEKYGTRYVLWLPRDNPPPTAAPEEIAAASQRFQALSAALAPAYDWHQFFVGDPYYVGVWIKR